MFNIFKTVYCICAILLAINAVCEIINNGFNVDKLIIIISFLGGIIWCLMTKNKK